MIHSSAAASDADTDVTVVCTQSFHCFADLRPIVDACEDDTSRYRAGGWRPAFPAKGFGPLHHRRPPYHHEGPAEDAIVGRARSVSFVAALPPDESRPWPPPLGRQPARCGSV